MKKNILLLILIASFSLNTFSQVKNFSIQYNSIEPPQNRIITSSVWKSIRMHRTFYAPWSKLTDKTTFQCYFSNKYLYFKFRVEDSTLTIKDVILKKTDIAPEDRAEIFLSPTKDMEKYYCMEVDPKGRNMEYLAVYKRENDYSWSFQTLQLQTEIKTWGYYVAGRLTLQEMKDLGFDIIAFYMGAFRADFKTSKSVVWYSLLKTSDKSPNFHKPHMIFPCSIKFK